MPHTRPAPPRPLPETRGTHAATDPATQRLKKILADAWAAPESSYAPLTAQEVIARNRPRQPKV